MDKRNLTKIAHRLAMIAWMMSLEPLLPAALAEGDCHGGRRGPPPELTTAQKDCFTAQGLVAPGEGALPAERPSRDVMDKVHACLKANGLERPARAPSGSDSDASS